MDRHDTPLSPVCYRHGDLRIKALFFFGHGVYGCFIPYLNLYFTELGFSDERISVLGVMLPLMKIAAPPIWGMASDSTERPRLLLAGVIAPAVLCMSLLMAQPGYAAALGLMAVFAFFYAPVVPMIDGATFKYVQRTGHDYSCLRLWGSIGFIVCTAGSGLPMYFWPGLRWFFAFLIPSGVLACYAALRIPDCPPLVRGKVGLRGFVIFKDFSVIVLTACSFLSWAAMASYYVFFSHFLTERGVEVYWIGAVWALGTLCEIPMMYYARRVLARVGVRGMLAMGLAGVVLRLGILSFEPPWGVVLCTQVLHALTLSAVLLPSVTYINRVAPDHLRSSAQGIYAAIVMGMGFGAGTKIAGTLRHPDNNDALMFRVHAAMALVALVLLLTLFRERREAEASA